MDVMIELDGFEVHVYKLATGTWAADAYYAADGGQPTPLFRAAKSRGAAERRVRAYDFCVPTAQARRLSELTRQRIEQLCIDGKVRRYTDEYRPRWLYHAGDLLRHRETAKPGRPGKAG